MKRFEIKGNYKGLELNLGTVATLSDDLQELKEAVKEKFGVSDVILEEVPYTHVEVSECLPF